ncbi:MAG TPA: hypothetical protein VKE40_14460 [Gemmataceae bacterium]|nr:hypothetical protein [Gemmataceae bacterium]
MSSFTVAKVGGSLYDLPDLRYRLQKWAGAVGTHSLLIPGGGPAADVVRRLDATHGLSEDASHWLAIRMLTVNAYFLATLLGVPIVGDLSGREVPLAVLDPFVFLTADEGRPGALGHRWAVTTDSIAARVAWVAHAELALLKSVELSPGVEWDEAARSGFVDPQFPNVVFAGRLRPSWINLRRPEFGSP